MKIAVQPPFTHHFPFTGFIVSNNWIQALADVDKTNRYLVYNHCLREYWSRKQRLFCPPSGNFELFIPPVPDAAAQWLSERMHFDVLGMLLRSKGAALVHALEASYLMPRRFPFVVTFYDMMPELFPEWTPPSFDVYKTIRRRNAENAVHIVANPTSTKRDLMRLYDIPEDKITVIDLGVNTDVFRVMKDKAELEAAARRYSLPKKFIMGLGHFRPKKNHERLIRAFAALARRDPELGLVLVGEMDGNHLPLTRLVEELRVPRVVFTGAVPEPDLVRLYNLASAFSHALVYEGFGLPLLEAMACGCPVVTSTSSSLPEVVGDAALLVEYQDVDGLVKALESILRNPETADRLRVRGFERIRRYTWENTARKTLDLYGRLVRDLSSRA